MARKTFNLEHHVKLLSFHSSKAVTEKFNDQIPLCMSDIQLIKSLIHRYDFDIYLKLWPTIFKLIKEMPADGVSSFRKRNQFTPSYILATLSVSFRAHIIMAIEKAGQSREEYDLLRYLIRWFGIERKQAKYFKEYIPGDNRHRYHEDYDGVTKEEFTLDHVALKHDDQVNLELEKDTHDNPDFFYDAQAMESAVENNSWSLDKVGV